MVSSMRGSYSGEVAIILYSIAVLSRVKESAVVEAESRACVGVTSEGVTTTPMSLAEGYGYTLEGTK